MKGISARGFKTWREAKFPPRSNMGRKNSFQHSRVTCCANFTKVHAQQKVGPVEGKLIKKLYKLYQNGSRNLQQNPVMSLWCLQILSDAVCVPLSTGTLCFWISCTHLTTVLIMHLPLFMKSAFFLVLCLQLLGAPRFPKLGPWS